MEKIIEFSRAQKKKRLKKDLYITIIWELKNNKGKQYSFSEITEYANRILNAGFQWTHQETYTRILTVVNKFNISIYTSEIQDSKMPLGMIGVNGITTMRLGCDKAIITDRRIDENLQLFITAYLLGLYLFDYLPSGKEEYYHIERMGNYVDNIMEENAYRFAMDIMMPRQRFLEQYNYAKKVNKSPYYIQNYLSDCFRVPKIVVQKRIIEIMKR